MNNLESFEKRIGYTFNNKKLLKMALTHSSYANEKRLPKSSCNERLEFLGDAVLELVMSEFLFESMKDVQEGELTRKRASMVCESTLDLCARDISLQDYLLLGHGEDRTGGRQRPSVVSDAFEALIGAIYLDNGFTSAKEFINKFVINDIEEKTLFYDSKTILQEIIQGKQLGNIRYELVNEFGPDHAKTFVIEVYVGESMIARGEGRTKKAASQKAAYKAILRYKSLEISDDKE